jgi:hypothetical protein
MRCLFLLLVLLIKEYCEALQEDQSELEKRSLQNQYYNYQSSSSSSSSFTAELSDIWLCLACAVGWTVWLIGSYKSAASDTVYDSEESIQVMGNVLEVSLGEDADGTGIPVYLALIDYVVEFHDGEADLEIKYNSQSLTEGVITSTATEGNGQPMQIRKCFYTNKLLTEGFANVKILCLSKDPTASILYEDYILDKKQKLPQDMVGYWLVNGMAAMLIISSLYGASVAVPKLAEEEQQLGWICLGLGVFFLYPAALSLYNFADFAYSWVNERKGTIIHGAQSWNCTRVACGLPHALEYDENDIIQDRNLLREQNAKEKSSNHAEPNGLEMPSLPSGISSPPSYNPPARQQYPNAGCGYQNYNVQYGGDDSIHKNNSGLSSISSQGTPNTKQNSPMESNSFIMEQFRALGTSKNSSS